MENDLKSRKAEAITAENNTPDIEFVQTEKYSEWEKESEFEYKKEINLQLLRDDISKILHNQNLETTRLLENMANTIANLQAKIEKLDSK